MTHFRRTGSAFPSTSGNGSCPATIKKWDNKDSKEQTLNPYETYGPALLKQQPERRCFIFDLSLMMRGINCMEHLVSNPHA